MSTDLVKQATTTILEAIIEQTFSPAKPLPPEAELAAFLNVSRPTMREAVKVLSSRGVLKVLHGKGTFVEPRENWTDLETLIWVESHTSTPRELGMRLVQVRRMIEVGACGLAATNRNSADIKAMAEHLADFDVADAADDIDGAVQADLNFHFDIFRASGNPFFPAIMQPLQDALRSSRYATTAIPEVRERAQGHHRQILKAIEKKDENAAKKAMRAHMTQTQDDIEALPAT
ncbi:MAG: FadR/GntR family transcriptional regulator [Actinomycetaceae bacterium]|nr:FadR/GntR family transcriptional regulator [Actinomycetaceae bacterium]